MEATCDGRGVEATRKRIALSYYICCCRRFASQLELLIEDCSFARALREPRLMSARERSRTLSYASVSADFPVCQQQAAARARVTTHGALRAAHYEKQSVALRVFTRRLTHAPSQRASRLLASHAHKLRAYRIVQRVAFEIASAHSVTQRIPESASDRSLRERQVSARTTVE